MGKQRKGGSALGNFARKYQGHFSLVYCGTPLVLRYLPTDVTGFQESATKMTSLNYDFAGPDGDVLYGSGRDDMLTIAYITIFFILLRIALKITMWDSIAAMAPIDPEKFTMQAWQYSYYVTAWVSGLYLYYHSDYWMNMKNMWVEYPQNTSMTMSFKLYYLCQIAFWCQMVFVTLIEKWQNDFVQMMMHHFITIFLTSTSYFFGYLRVGHVVLVEQDLADIMLPWAKMFKYFVQGAETELTRAAGQYALGKNSALVDTFQAAEKALKASKKGTKEWKTARMEKTDAIQAIVEFAKKAEDPKTVAASKHRDYRQMVHGSIQDALFALFAITWIPTRHFVFFIILHSIYADCGPSIKAQGIGFDPAKGHYGGDYVVPIYLCILGFFQCLLIGWLIDLLKAVYKALCGPKNITDMEDPHEADSDSDDDDEPLLAGKKKNA